MQYLLFIFHEFDDYLVVIHAGEKFVIIGWTESSTDTVQDSEIYMTNRGGAEQSYKRVRETHPLIQSIFQLLPGSMSVSMAPFTT